MPLTWMLQGNRNADTPIAICTRAKAPSGLLIFRNSGAETTDCRFDTNATDHEGMFRPDSGESVRVRIQNASGDTVSLDGVRLETGVEAPSSVSVTTSRRTVGIDGTTYWLEVRAW